MMLYPTKAVGLSLSQTEASESFKVNRNPLPEEKFDVPGLPEPKDPQQAHKLWRASKAMETLFSKYLLKEVGKMMSTTNHSPGSKIYGDMFKDALAEKVADSNSLGLAQQIYLDVQKTIERNNETPKGIL